MTAINANVAKQAIFKQEFRKVVEDMNILSDFATKLVAWAQTIYSPFTSVTAAKSYTGGCKTPIATLTLGQNSLSLDRYIGNAVTDCEEELSYARYDVIGSIRRDLYASVMKKQNTLSVSDIVAGATVVAGTEDLSTSDKIRTFLTKVAATSGQVVGLRTEVDGAKVVRAKYHEMPFVACGIDAFVAITSAVGGMVSASSLEAINGKVVKTPFGVAVINLGDAADDPKRLIYGVGGVPTIAFREDKIEVGMGEMVSQTTQSGADLELANGDAILSKKWYAFARTIGKNGIFANVQSLVSTRLMA